MNDYYIPLLSIAKVFEIRKTNELYSCQISCKDFQSVVFKITNPGSNLSKLMNLLTAQPSIESFFAFQNKEYTRFRGYLQTQSSPIRLPVQRSKSIPPMEGLIGAQSIPIRNKDEEETDNDDAPLEKIKINYKFNNPFNPKEEYERIGLTVKNGWKLSRINKNYEYSNTYPSSFVVPEKCTKELLLKVSQFRSRGRIPVTVWMHPVNHASLTRCAQPRVGISIFKSKSRCNFDENLIDLIRENSFNKKLEFVDSRPKKNARANHLRQGGYEDADFYSNAPLSFLEIENIHVVRDAFVKLATLCQYEDSNCTVFSSLIHLEKTLFFFHQFHLIIDLRILNFFPSFSFLRAWSASLPCHPFSSPPFFLSAHN